MSSTSSESSNCCSSCCKSILYTGFSFLFLFIIYRVTTKDPRIYLTGIYGTGPGANVAPAITCQILIRNRARFLGIYYDDLLVSVAYPPEAASNMSAVIPAFYQGFHKRAFKEAALLGGPWVKAKAGAAAENGSAALLRVGVDTRFRYKAAMIWKSKRYRLSVSEDVHVNADGKIAPDHTLLRSAALHRSATIGWPPSAAAVTMVALAMLSII